MKNSKTADAPPEPRLKNRWSQVGLGSYFAPLAFDTEEDEEWEGADELEDEDGVAADPLALDEPAFSSLEDF